jgi:hypothetical protein
VRKGGALAEVGDGVAHQNGRLAERSRRRAPRRRAGDGRLGARRQLASEGAWGQAPEARSFTTRKSGPLLRYTVGAVAD